MLYRVAHEIGGIASIDELLSRVDMVDLNEWIEMIRMWDATKGGQDVQS